MKTRILNYENNQITFNLKKDNGVMINASEMANVFGKQASKFLENESTKSFIESCLKKQNSAFLNVNKLDDLYNTHAKSISVCD